MSTEQAAAPTATPPVVAPVVTPPDAAAKPPEAKKLDISFDEQVKADLAFKKHEKAVLTELENKRKELDGKAKRYETLEPVMTRIEKGEVADAIWDIPGVKWTPELVMSLVDRVAAMQPATEVPVEDKIKAAIEADRKEREEAAAAEATKKTEAERAEWAQDFGDYMTAVVGTKEKPGFLAAHKTDFPLCNAWAHKIELAKVEAELQRRLQKGESVEAGEVFKVFEAEFQAEIDKTPFGKKVEAAPTAEGFEASEKAYFEARKPKLVVEAKAPETVEPVGKFAPTPGKSFDEAASEYFRRLDAEKKTRVRF